MTRRRTIENVALTLDFPSVNAMRNQLRHYADLSPTEAREGGGLAVVLAAFRNRRGVVNAAETAVRAANRKVA